MKIAVLNGSPKGMKSVTMQYFKYLEKLFPGHNFTYINVAQKCRLYENNDDKFNEVLEIIKNADLVFWGTPVYFLLIPSRLKQFIELIFTRNKQDIFRGKYSGVLTTSIHFADHTSNNYLRSISEDLGMNHVDFFPAEMQDLKKPEMRKSLAAFFKRILSYKENGLPVQKISAPLRSSRYTYSPDESSRSVNTSRKITIIADIESADSNIAGMVNRFRMNFPKTDFVNLRTLKMNNCTGCLRCGFDSICVYENTKDEYNDFYRDRVLSADILVFAGSIHDRYLSSYWQRYLERSFMRNHQPVLKGKQVIFLISGPVSQDNNIREILQMYVENMQANLVNIITDECENSDTIDGIIDSTAADAVGLSENGISRPVTFLGKGGNKIFRDDIYGGLRFVFQDDHRYYKKTGFYDFPTKKRVQNLLITLLTVLSKIPFLRQKIQKEITAQMLLPYRGVLKNALPLKEEEISFNSKYPSSPTEVKKVS
jgi:multimeric flavodoxin WrbA